LVARAAEPLSEIKIEERLPELSGEFLTGQEAVLLWMARDGKPSAGM
jgi:hypothetical protein